MGMKKTTRRQLKSIRRRRLALALAGALAMPAAPALAQTACSDCLPQYGQVVSGSATSNYSSGGVIRPNTDANDNTMTITQTTNGAIIDWGSFGIGSAYNVQFVVPNSASVTLNRVVGFLGPGYGVNASQIDGRMSSNGNVFLINPAGITFGNGSQVNVGGLLASTLWMNSGDFINGLATGQYHFNGFNGDPSTTHQVRNNSEITYNADTGVYEGGLNVGAGGATFVGPSLYNGGDIVATGGNIGFGAGTQVTVDFFGDGLTQITLNAAPTVDSGIVQDDTGSMTADGGSILMRSAMSTGGTAGGIAISGLLRAQTVGAVAGRIELTSDGQVMLGAPGIFSDASSPYTPGTLDVTGQAGEDGGAVLIQGGSVVLANDSDNPFNPTEPSPQGSLINASGGRNGGQVDIQSAAGVFALPRSTIAADGGVGEGGQIRVVANSSIWFLGANVSAGSKTANGGSIGVQSVGGDILVGANAVLGGGLYAGGPGNGGQISLYALAGQIASAAQINASGGVDGGQVVGVAESVTLTELSETSADGGTGTGGTVGFRGTTSLAAYGQLSARGGSIGGNIYTTSGGTFDLRGVQVDAGSGNVAGTWWLSAPELAVVNGAATGTLATMALGTTLQDAEINRAFATGSNVVLQSAGNVDFDGAQLLAASPLALSLQVHAQGGIYGNAFSIASSGGTLDMAFNANSAGVQAGGSGIAFDNATLSSNGGDILMYGGSDVAAGRAIGDDNGIALNGVDLSTDGGDVLLRGESTGAAATTGNAGVRMQDSDIDAGTGGVSIDGLGAGTASGIFASGGAIHAGVGGIDMDGVAGGAGHGIYLDDVGVIADGGDILLTGQGGGYGVYASYYAGLRSNGGDIVVHGEGGTAAGTYLFGGMDSGGGDIDLYGSSSDAEGLVFRAGFFNAMDSGGGSIDIVGNGATGGVSLIGSGYGSNSIDSGGGLVTIVGTASGADAVGTLVSSLQIIGGSGDVGITGTSANGIGLQFADGAGVDTTTGAIGLYGTGAGFGLDIADGALDTDSGDITLVGEATATDATAGVRVTGDGLTTDGGDITVRGTSAGGVGVQLGDGSDPFAVGSGGGAILIEGTGVTAGVLMQDNQVDSGGGAVTITGEGGALGVSLDDGSVDSGGGDIAIEGTADDADGIGVSLYAAQLTGGAGDVIVRGTAAGGIGIALADGSGIDTTTGAIGLYGTGAGFGLDIADGALDTDSGDITLVGEATAADATAGVRVTGDGLVTNGGDITVRGTSAGGVGVQLGDGSDPFVVGSGGGAILIEGTGVTAGVLMQDNQVASGGGAVSITGEGANRGVSLASGSIDSAGGDIDVDGEASGSGIGVDLADARLVAAAGDIRVRGISGIGTGINFSGQSAVSTTTGDIGLTGVGGLIGLDLTGVDVSTTSGHLDLRGRGQAPGALGLRLGAGTRIATQGGGIELSGEGNIGAGIQTLAGSSIDAGNSLVVLRAATSGNGDAIALGGTVHSDLGVNLRPGGVSEAGDAYERAADEIRIGTGTGFALSAAELARIDAPELVIGSSLHAGAIRVLEAVARNGNLTLQNQGGSGGIDLQAGLDVGSHTLALASGGSITQAATAAIRAHSLLAMAGGDVLLGTAQNDVASTTLAGSAGGDFEFLDANTLAIGSVGGVGFNADANSLSSMGATGITAGGDALVRNLSGDMTLNAGVTATNIDLVTAGRLQNVAGASLVASGDWRVWANTWEGETRGGLAGSGNLPNLYGCLFLGACGVTVPGTDNHFIYEQQPTALITFGNATREYGLPNPAFAFSVTGAILGDSAANVATGTATTTATIGSDVGQYAIAGTFTSAAGYRIQLVPGTLAITPATLLFTADSFVRYLGTPNPSFDGEVTGFRNGDTVQSVFGSTVIWTSPAGLLSPIGYYPIIGGSATKNYVFAQAPGNASALQIVPLPQLSDTPVNFVRETIDTYVYDRNFGAAPVCALNASLDDQQLAGTGDPLSTEWSKVRSRPNLTNCFDSERENGCGSF